MEDLSLKLKLQQSTPEVLAVAGETSGDILGASILQALQQQHAIDLTGVGGQALLKQGQKQFFDCHDLAVRGYVEALPAVFRVLKIRHFLKKYLEKNKPKLYLGIDAADFNLHIEQFACKYSKVAHIISPSIWAWRAERIEKIKKAVDHLFCIFPFEPAIYEKAGVAATFIGHPLANQIDQKWHEHARQEAIAILPGSRKHEIQNLLPVFLETSFLLFNEGLQKFYLPIANPIVLPLIQDILQIYAKKSKHHQFFIENIECVHSMQEALIHAQIALVASGTASLEVALYGTPMLIAYQVPRLTAFLMKRQALINCVGLPNILQQKFFNDPQLMFVPEALQNLEPKNLAGDLIKLIKGEDLELCPPDINHLNNLNILSKNIKKQITNAAMQKEQFKIIHQNLQTLEILDDQNNICINTGLIKAADILASML